MNFTKAILTGLELEDTTQTISTIEKYANELMDWLARKGFKLLLTLLFIFVCTRIIKLVLRLVKRSFDKANVEKSVAGFILSFIKIGLYILLFISAIGLLGFEVTTLVTIFGAGSITIGLALQGSLSNLAGGVLILILKPFVVGDYIIENDKNCEGTVDAIDIFYTKLRTPDNKIIVIPNGNISANSLVNLTSQVNRRVDLKVGVAYDTDMKKLKDVVEEVLRNQPQVLPEEGHDIFIDEFGDSALNIVIRYWVKTEDYWKSRWDTTEGIKASFEQNNIEIPFNKLDVTVNNK